MTKTLRPDLEAPLTHSHTIALHLAQTCLPSISQSHLPVSVICCKRFIQFARSRSRNKDYLDALKTVEKLLSLIEVALRNFSESETKYTYPSPPSTLGEPRSDSNDYLWDDSETSSTVSSDSWPTSYSDASTGSDIREASDSGNWKWITNLVVLFWETVQHGKCDVITDPRRNSWSRFIESRYHDWLAGGDVSLALDHRDSVDQELRHSSFDFTKYVEELLMPGRRYGLLLEALSVHRSFVLPLEMDADEDHCDLGLPAVST